MKTTVTENSFMGEFERMGRADNFTWEGLRALFSYLEELEAELHEEIELDVIALCCEYSEHELAEEAAAQYGWEADDDDTPGDQEEDAKNFLRDHTTVIEVDNGHIIIQDF